MSFPLLPHYHYNCFQTLSVSYLCCAQVVLLWSQPLSSNIELGLILSDVWDFNSLFDLLNNLFWRGDKTDELQITFDSSEILVQVLGRITQYSTQSRSFLKIIVKLLIKNNVPRVVLIAWETCTYIQGLVEEVRRELLCFCLNVYQCIRYWSHGKSY